MLLGPCMYLRYLIELDLNSKPSLNRSCISAMCNVNPHKPSEAKSKIENTNGLRSLSLMLSPSSFSCFQILNFTNIEFDSIKTKSYVSSVYVLCLSILFSVSAKRTNNKKEEVSHVALVSLNVHYFNKPKSMCCTKGDPFTFFIVIITTTQEHTYAFL